MTGKRHRGRPRKKPPGVKRREWWATDAEIRRLQKEAKQCGLSVQELVRRRALGLPID